MKHLLVYLKGLAMGACDVVPGVSGGTVAFITGIYERLINALASADLQALKLLFSGKIKAFWERIDGTFLLVLFAGVFTSILSLAKLISRAIETEPVLTWAFFFGLIAASCVLVVKKVSKWNLSTYSAAAIGVLVGLWVTMQHPLEVESGELYIFLSGLIAISAMILPGISGSFILLILGSYTVILDAVKSLDVPKLIVFALGCAVGLLTISRVLKWLFARWHDVAVALLFGFMVGALNKVWPWKEAPEQVEGLEPDKLMMISDNALPDSQVLPAVAMALLGAAIVLGIGWAGQRLSGEEA